MHLGLFCFPRGEEDQHAPVQTLEEKKIKEMIYVCDRIRVCYTAKSLPGNLSIRVQ